MLTNQRQDVAWIVKTIGAQKNVKEVRLLNKKGRIIVSSIKEKTGILVDKKTEGCIVCHKGKKILINKKARLTRIYREHQKERLIGIMNPIYNEQDCQNCHPKTQKILGVLDVILSLKETDKEIYKSKISLLLLIGFAIFAISLVVVKSTYDHQLAHNKLRESYQKLEKYDILRAEFVRHVAHQLRSPAAAIKSCLKVVLDGYAPKEKQREMLERAEKRTGSLIHLVNELLDLATIEESQKIKEIKKVELAQLLNKTVEFLKEKAKEKNINLTLQLLPPIPNIMANYEEIEWIITNLIDNAIKYTTTGGNVFIIGEKNKDIKIIVKDTGIGIPKEDIPHIFDEFYRGENAKSYEKEGTGLGLAIAKRAVEKYGGQLEVISEIKKGTTFIIHLPASIIA